jgi:FKBP-type peptidyl-prolyl cis-trans isomerase
MSRSLISRTSTILPVLAIAAALALAGCSPERTGSAASDDPTDAPVSTACVDSGTESDSVTVNGEIGTDPAATFDTPLKVDATQRTVVTEGTGDPVEDGASVDVEFTIYNAATGEVATSTGYGATGQLVPVEVDETQTLAGFVKAIRCTPVGSRVVAVVAPDEAFGSEGFSSDAFSIDPDTSIVVVMDVVSVVQPVQAVEWTENVPDVTFDDAGIPTVTLPAGTPPTDLLLTVLKQGDGDTVKDGDSVTVNYQGTSWDTGEIFDESYTKTPATFSTDGVIQGFTAALVGQKVGTTVMVSIPPVYGYGTDASAAPLGGQTLLFVITIEGVN